jgi:RNA polymerase sigma-70 factor (ECF subfamily)
MDSNSNDLLERARRFEPKALTNIYEAYSNRIFAYAFRLLGSADLAEDCTAETFSRFLLAMKNGGGPEKYLQAYLYRVAHNWISDHYRRQPASDLELSEDFTALGEHLEKQAEVAIRQGKIRQALKALTADQRQVIALRYLEGMENEEVARVMQKEIGAIKALQFRALAGLRRALLHQRTEE